MKSIAEKLKDSNYYLQNFIKIKTKDGNLVGFRFNHAQRMLDAIVKSSTKVNKPVRIIILKARQLGMSTYTEAELFRRTATTPYTNSMIVAHEDKATQNLFNMSKLMYEELPDVLRPMRKHNNETALSFENPISNEQDKRDNPGLRSKITVATAKNVESGRSGTIHNMHISELAFWQNAERTMLGLLQQVPNTPNTMIIIESTANGVGGYFYNMWKKAEKGLNEYIPVFLPWFVDPTYCRDFETASEQADFIMDVEDTHYDKTGKVIYTEEKILKETHNLSYQQLYWRKYIIANYCNGDAELFKQEYPSTPDEAFIASGRPKFSVASLKKYMVKVAKGEVGNIEISQKQLKFIENTSGALEVWAHPQSGVNYCIGADVSEGLAEGDWSVAQVLDEDFNHVARLRLKTDPDLFGNDLVNLAKYYNDAYLGVEANNHGLTTLKSIQHEEYWNIFYSKHYDKIADKLTQKMGWTTNMRTKPLMIDKLAVFIREMYLSTCDEIFINECLTYIIEDNGSTNAQIGEHDDTVMAMGIAIQLAIEGRGEDYEPEIERSSVKRRSDQWDDDDDQHVECS